MYNPVTCSSSPASLNLCVCRAARVHVYVCSVMWGVCVYVCVCVVCVCVCSSVCVCM